MFNNPYAYNPYAVPYQPQNQTTAPIRNSNENSIVWVNGLSEAENYLVAPNSAVQLWDRNGKAVYVKSADQTGLNKIKIYDLIERKIPEETISTDNKEFALKEDLTALQSDFENLKGIVDGLTSNKTKKEVKKDE